MHDKEASEGDAVPSDERADKARRPANPVPPGAGGGLRMTALASLDRAPPCRRSAALSCSPGATRAAEPYLRIGPKWTSFSRRPATHPGRGEDWYPRLQG